MANRRTTIFTYQDDVKVENKDVNNRIVKSKQCCLTCGKNSRIQWIERQDGKKVIKEACLYCICRVHTAANRERD
jgi:hypothetical protein